jgi:hypothetical protein
VKSVIAFVIAGVSAYSFSFAIDLLLGGMIGVYPSTAFLPVVTWSVIAMITGFAALCLAPTNRFLVIPFAVITMLAFLGGIVGQRYSLIVGVVMLAQTLGAWGATSHKKDLAS